MKLYVNYVHSEEMSGIVQIPQRMTNLVNLNWTWTEVTQCYFPEQRHLNGEICKLTPNFN